jgi:hypothetical protein
MVAKNVMDSFKRLLSYVVFLRFSQIWLNHLVDDCQFGYMKNLNTNQLKNPDPYCGCITNLQKNRENPETLCTSNYWFFFF